MAHTGFNILNVGLFLFLVHPLARLLVWLVPEKEHRETPRLALLDVRMLDTPALGIAQSRKEVLRMAGSVEKMLARLRLFLTEEDDADTCAQDVFEREETLDVVQKEITEFLTRLLSGNVGSQVVQEARSQLRMADEFESISDYVQSILKLLLKLKKADEKPTEEGLEALLRLHDHVETYVHTVSEAVRQSNTDILSTARAAGERITLLVKDCRSGHLARIGTEQGSAIKSLVLTDVFHAYRRIKDHAVNIAEVVAGEK